jgi:tetratricopeptide (TPR) repeat protein
MTLSTKRLSGVALVLLMAASQALAIKGVIVGTDNRRMSGDIRWQQAKKEYILTADGVTMTLKPSQVKQVIVSRPAGLDKAVADVKGGRFAAALPALETFGGDYTWRQGDVRAARNPAQAQLGLKNARQAILICERLIEANPQAAFQGDLAEIYWQALVEDGREATLTKIMNRIVKEGSRDLAALAQIRRADVAMKKSAYRDALVDGYLRTYVLYNDVPQYAPEALFKSVKCFEQLNESANAEKMRKRLLAEFPDSSYSKQIAMGK